MLFERSVPESHAKSGRALGLIWKTVPPGGDARRTRPGHPGAASRIPVTDSGDPSRGHGVVRRDT
jgi:hypothetical protein